MKVRRVDRLSDGSTRIVVSVDDVDRKVLSAILGHDVCSSEKRIIRLSNLLQMLNPHTALFRPTFPQVRGECLAVLHVDDKEDEFYRLQCKNRGINDPMDCYRFIVEDLTGFFISAFFSGSMGVVENGKGI